jgi:hypothetical protein
MRYRRKKNREKTRLMPNQTKQLPKSSASPYDAIEILMVATGALFIVAVAFVL